MPTQVKTPTRTFEVWMFLPEDRRKKLLTLMTIQDVSARQLAQAAGWKSHSYLQRLLRGEVRTLKPEPAVKIAAYLKVDLETLFLPRTSSATGRNIKPQRTRRVA